MSTVEWRDLPGYEGRYRISSTGMVRSLRRGINVGSRNNHGYFRVNLTDAAGKATTKDVHRLVALTFLGEPQGRVVRHLNGKQTDNRVENLQYGTVTENNQDIVDHGHHQNASKTHCRNGHPYDAVNTRRADGARVCRVCNLAAVKRYQARKREGAGS